MAKHIDVVQGLGWAPLASRDHSFAAVCEYLSVSLCNPRHRVRWWTTGPHVNTDEVVKRQVTEQSGAAGRLISDVLNFRAMIARKKGKGPTCSVLPRLSLQAVEDAIRNDKTITLEPDDRQLKDFLQGSPHDSGLWWSYAGQILRFVLVAEVTESDLKDALPYIDRICGFFFPPRYEKPRAIDCKLDELTFFDPRLQFHDSEATTTESIAAIWRARYAHCRMDGGGAVCIYRTSAGPRFQQVSPDGKRLLPSGAETIAALREGVCVVYVVPKEGQRWALPDGKSKLQTWVGAADSISHFISLVQKEKDGKVLLKRLYWIEVDLADSGTDKVTVSAPSSKPQQLRAVVRSAAGTLLERAAFLSPLMRFVAHGSLGSSGEPIDKSINVLLGRRCAPAGLIPRSTDDEVLGFSRWVNLVCAPGMRAINKARGWEASRPSGTLSRA